MSLQEYLYSQTTISGVLVGYISELSEQDGVQSQLHANQWRSYKERMMDPTYIKDLQILFNSIYDELYKEYPELNFTIEGRRKSLVSMEKKILHYTQSNKSLDLIRDFFAFRIVLFGSPELNLVEYCYRVIAKIIEFSAPHGFSPCDRAPLMDVKSLEHHENDYFDHFPYRHYIKDYICFPKENGYQSIHLTLVDIKGRHLEIQVRTLEMHILAEAGAAEHSEYKDKKYIQDFPLDQERIKVNGYVCHNNKVIDLAGVESALVVFQRQKTF